MTNKEKKKSGTSRRGKNIYQEVTELGTSKSKARLSKRKKIVYDNHIPRTQETENEKEDIKNV